MATCCGRKLDAPFCRWCGKPPSGNEINELLRYLSSTVAVRKCNERVYEAKFEEVVRGTFKARTEMLKGWRDALKELIERDKDGKP